jgi:hypothetical protein
MFFHGMKTKLAVIAGMIALSSVAEAGYLDLLRDFDLKILCVVSWFAPAIAMLLFLIGGVLLATGSPANRVLGKAMIYDSILGLILVVGFILLSLMLIPKLDIAACYGG